MPGGRETQELVRTALQTVNASNANTASARDAVTKQAGRLAGMRKHIIQHDDLKGRHIGGVYKITEDSGVFCIDSGATTHVCSDFALFKTFDENSSRKRTVSTASGEVCKVEGVGDVEYRIQNDKGTIEKHIISGVLFIPSFGCNVFSVRKLWKNHHITCKFRDDLVITFPTGSSVHIPTDGTEYDLTVGATFRGPRKGTQRSAKNWIRTVKQVFISRANNVSDELLHARLGHAHAERIIRTAATSKSSRLRTYRGHAKCESCAANSRKKSFHTSTKHVYTFPGERVYSDLCGPFPASAAGNFCYAICFVDAFSKYAAVYFLKSKHSDGVKDALQRFIAEHKQVIPTVREWFTDNGGEFCSSDIDEFCHEIAVVRRYSVPYCPPQNGTAERLWGLLLQPMRIMFHASRVPRTFWPECMEHCTMLHNALSKNKGLSPLERAGLPPINHDKFRQFGCKVYFNIPHVRYRVGFRLKKLADSAVLGVHLGCDPERPGGYRIFLPQLNKIVSAYHLEWFETRFCNFSTVPNVRKHEGELDDNDFANFQPNVPDDIVDNDECEPDGEREIGAQDDTFVAARHDVRANAMHVATPQFDSVDAGDAEVSIADARKGAKPGDFAGGICDMSGCEFAKHPPNTLHSFQTPVPGTAVSDGVVSGRTRRKVTFRRPRNQRHAFKVTNNEPVRQRDYVLFPQHKEDCFSMWYSEDPHSSHEICLKLSEHGPIPIPLTAAQALAGPLGPRWKQAMDDEIAKLLSLNAWRQESRSIPRSKGRRITGSRWVFDVKYNKDGTLKKLKARFVVKGFTQQEGIDYDRSFSSTLRASSFRTFLAISSGRKFPIRHLDVTNAFVQADLDDVDLWIEPPPRGDGSSYADVEGQDANGKDITKVCYLLRALYGTKQASRLFQAKLCKWLKDNQFVPSPADPCIYHKKTSDGEILLGTYVDDLLISYSSRSMFDAFEKQFTTDFACTASESLSWFLGIGVEQISDTHDCIAIHQSKYIEDMVKRFIPSGASNSIMRKIPISTELLERCGPPTSDVDRDYARTKPYMEIVGSLLWVSTMSRPDVAYHMSILCKHMADPNGFCFEAATQLLLYLYATRHSCIVYGGKSDKENYDFHAYSDASWSVPHPMAGYVVKINGGIVSYAAKKLKVVAASSCEAEYAACTMCAHDITFVRSVCNDLGFTIKGTVPIFVDNKACITLCDNVQVSSNNKHFARAIHYIRDQVQDLHVKCIFVRAELQMADAMTKPVQVSMFVKCRDYMLNLVRSK